MEIKKIRPPRRDSLVGDAPDILPFAWRTPPVLPRNCSKYLRDKESERQKRITPAKS